MTQTTEVSALTDIVSRASTIWERLRGPFGPEEPDERQTSSRLETWCETVAKGDWDMFRHRLAWEGLNVDSVRPALGRVTVDDGAPLPAWAEFLDEVMAVAPEDDPPEAVRCLHAEERLPFEEILLPFVTVARKRLKRRESSSLERIAPEALGSLERSLLRTLADQAADVLYLEFSIARAQRQSGLARLFARSQEEPDREVYREFVQQVRNEGMAGIFREYPVLGRLLATSAAVWVDAMAEFAGRLTADWDDIQRLFAGGQDLGQVARLTPGLSDRHEGGRTVIALGFSSGLKLVYKPKSLETEEAYGRFLRWLNNAGAPLPLKVLQVLDRSTYGWVEFVEHLPCDDEAAAARYFRRAGMLLCLVYLLEATDCHRENIIASGEHPVLIDMETLLHHRLVVEDESERGQAQVMAERQMEHSVLRTGLLPTWAVNLEQGLAYEMSGLGGAAEQSVPYQMRDWKHVNTDAMDLAYRWATMTAGDNVPQLDGRLLPMDEYAEILTTGFEEMYRFLMAHREALLEPDSPLRELARQRVRIVFRATRVYALVARQLLSPTYTRDGADWSIGLELLMRAAVPTSVASRESGRRTIFWPMYLAERQAMERGDVPFFLARSNSDSMTVSLPGAAEVTIEGAFREPSFERVVSGLRSMDDVELQRQIGFIWGTVYSLVARDTSRSIPVREIAADGETSPLQPLERDALLAEATRIADEVGEHAIRGPEGGAAWIVPHYIAQAERYQLSPAGFDLYDGAPGIALFMAAMAKVTGGVSYRNLALDAVQPLRMEVRHFGERTVQYMPIGGAGGIGSMVYGLSRIALLLDEEALLHEARMMAPWITPAKIEEDRSFDVISGAAGAILSLMALHDVAPDDGALETAVLCARHLLDMRTGDGNGHRAWVTYEDKRLTGFSHGAGGIAYALLRLYRATQLPELRAAAEEAIAYEDSLFMPDRDNWPDLREEQPAAMTGWCHGAPGIGLARYGSLGTLDSPRLRQDIDSAMKATQTFAQGTDTLCCGAMGRGDVMLTLGRRLNRPELEDAARSQVARTVAEAHRSGRYFLHPQLSSRVYNPSLFQGMSGIGFTLLRQAYPDQLPAILLWE